VRKNIFKNAGKIFLKVRKNIFKSAQKYF